MIPISDAPPPGAVDRRDGSTKGENGITTVGCLFCPDQIAASNKYVENYKSHKWADKDACQVATCPFWNRSDCWQKMAGRKLDPKTNCPIYKRRQVTGEWDVEREII